MESVLRPKFAFHLASCKLILLGQAILLTVLSCSSLNGQEDRESVLELIRDLQSDSYKTSQQASEELQDLLWSRSLQYWFSDQMHEGFADEVEPRFYELDALLSHCNRHVVLATLEVIARHGHRGKEKAEIVKELMNDFSQHLTVRQHAFRTLCCITPKNESVLEQAWDIGLVFDLYNIEATLEEDQEDSVQKVPTSKYSGLGMTAEYVVGWMLEPTGHLDSELKALAENIKPERPKVVRIFCLFLVGLMEEKAADALEAVKAQMKDEDLEVQGYAVRAALMIDHSEATFAEVIELGAIDEAGIASLRRQFESLDAMKAEGGTLFK